jgi:hypothetical protein
VKRKNNPKLETAPVGSVTIRIYPRDRRKKAKNYRSFNVAGLTTGRGRFAWVPGATVTVGKPSAKEYAVSDKV